MKEILYEGYIITASPYQLADNKMWSTHVHISKDRGGSFTSKPFSASNTFKSESPPAKREASGSPLKGAHTLGKPPWGSIIKQI
jgi:hypothetical protein